MTEIVMLIILVIKVGLIGKSSGFNVIMSTIRGFVNNMFYLFKASGLRNLMAFASASNHTQFRLRFIEIIDW